MLLLVWFISTLYSMLMMFFLSFICCVQWWSLVIDLKKKNEILCVSQRLPLFSLFNFILVVFLFFRRSTLIHDFVYNVFIFLKKILCFIIYIIVIHSTLYLFSNIYLYCINTAEENTFSLYININTQELYIPKPEYYKIC